MSWSFKPVVLSSSSDGKSNGPTRAGLFRGMFQQSFNLVSQKIDEPEEGDN
jgi:hypothetical protein